MDQVQQIWGTSIIFKEYNSLLKDKHKVQSTHGVQPEGSTADHGSQGELNNFLVLTPNALIALF